MSYDNPRQNEYEGAHHAETATDPLTTAANTAWLEYAKGTWSETDRRIFVEGFRRGWQAHSEYLDVGRKRFRERLNNDDCCHFQEGR